MCVCSSKAYGNVVHSDAVCVAARGWQYGHVTGRGQQQGASSWERCGNTGAVTLKKQKYSKVSQ